GYGTATVGAVCVVPGSFNEMDDGFEKFRTAASSESRLPPNTKPWISFFITERTDAAAGWSDNQQPTGSSRNFSLFLMMDHNAAATKCRGRISILTVVNLVVVND